MNKSTTAMQLHIKMMKMHLEIMESGTIQFNTLLKLIRDANELLDLERMDIETSYTTGYINSMKGNNLNSSKYYEEKYETKAETTVS